MAGEAGQEAVTPRAVFDCMVFLQGAGRPAGPARACFHLVEEGRVTLLVSPEILAEIRDVLTRPKILRKFPLLWAEWVEAFVRNVESKAVLLAEVPRAFTLERDRKDEPYLNLALAAGAHYLVSRDLDLLDLMADDNFRQRYPDLNILDPPAFLQAVTGPRHSEQVTGPEPEHGAEERQGPAPSSPPGGSA
jgi:putative PIN family toxin of toxin-antitoxin system